MLPMNFGPRLIAAHDAGFVPQGVCKIHSQGVPRVRILRVKQVGSHLLNAIGAISLALGVWVGVVWGSRLLPRYYWVRVSHHRVTANTSWEIHGGMNVLFFDRVHWAATGGRTVHLKPGRGSRLHEPVPFGLSDDASALQGSDAPGNRDRQRWAAAHEWDGHLHRNSVRLAADCFPVAARLAVVAGAHPWDQIATHHPAWLLQSVWV